MIACLIEADLLPGAQTNSIESTIILLYSLMIACPIEEVGIFPKIKALRSSNSIVFLKVTEQSIDMTEILIVSHSNLPT